MGSPHGLIFGWNTHLVSYSAHLGIVVAAWLISASFGNLTADIGFGSSEIFLAICWFLDQEII
jgi:hypothetical protein